MKQLATIGAVAVLLLVAAVYFNTQKKPDQQTPIIVEAPVISENAPVIDGTVNGTLTLKSAISNGYLPAGATRDLYATIDINASKFSTTSRPPLNIAVVMDRSGSMSGEKIEKARAAARQLVTVLNENDRVAVISYGSDVTVDFPSAPVSEINRPRLLQAINRVKVGGGTNLSGGFQRGYAELSKWNNGKTVNRVILMSDGHANIGITHSPALIALSTKALKTRVSVTTMGVGLDYNEELMTQMANQGAGNYYFVDRANQIISFFDSELKGLSTTVASNASVVLDLDEGVTLAELHGFPHRVSGSKVYISLAEFYSEQKKSILLKLKANANIQGDKPIYKVSLSYDDLVNKKPENHKLKLKSIVTNDASKVASKVNVDVISRVQQVEVATNLQKAMELFDAGDAEGAQSVITATEKRVQRARKKHKFKKSARFDEEVSNLRQVKKEMQSSPSPTKKKRMIKSQKSRGNAILFDSF